MAKEYIEREAVLKFFEPYVGVGEEMVEIDTALTAIHCIPAADVIEVFRGKDSVLAEFEDDYKDFDKIKTHFAQIIVEGKIEEPCYSILWWDEENKEYNVGYSSYCLDYVRKWLELVFEVVVDAPAADVVEVVRGRWKLHDDGSGTCDQCNVTQKHIWDDDGWQNYCGVCGADMRERRDNNA